eukprot:gene400-473_t
MAKVAQLEQSPFHLPILKFLVTLLDGQFFPPIAPASKFRDSPIDYSLNPFLAAQKMDKITTITFKRPLFSLESIYEKEIQSLDDTCASKLNILTKLSNLYLFLKPISFNDNDAKFAQIVSMFKVIKAYQKTNTCDLVLKIQKNYAKEFKHRRILTDIQEESMNQWFLDHIESEMGPYPDESEKAILGALNNMSCNQLSNWFGKYV